MKIAALDLGSNTFLCLIAEVDAESVLKTYHDEVEVVRLGQDLAKNGCFSEEALVRADKCLKKFSEIIKTQNPQHVLAMATAAARNSSNQERLFALAKKYNIPLEIIPGSKEAEITYAGALSGALNKQKNYLVVDIGGGSTEIIFGSGLKLNKGISCEIGAVQLTEKHFTAHPPAPQQLIEVFNDVENNLLNVKKLFGADLNVDEIVAVAGTPTSLVAAELKEYNSKKIDGVNLSQEKLEDWLVKLKKASIPERINMGIPSGRADVILAGVIILLTVLKMFKKDKLTVSTRGVRYGVALEMAHRFNKPL